MRDVEGGKADYRFWQPGGGHDRNLYSAEEIWEKVDYVHRNPVKRKLCAREEDWMWSSARAHRDASAGPLRLNLEHLPRRPMV